MGQLKKLMMDYDDTLNNLYDFLGRLKEQSDNIEYRQDIEHLIEVIIQVAALLDNYRSIYKSKAILLVSYAISKGESYLNQGLNKHRLNLILDDFENCKRVLRNEKLHNESAILNSSEYYENVITSLNNRLDELTNQLNQRTTKHAELETEKRQLEEQISQFRRKEEQAKQREDAKATWKSAIEVSFKILDTDIQPIKDEKQRLKCLYWAYCILSAFMLVVLIVAEIIAIVKLNDYIGIPPFRIYISLIAPIPVTLALLFVFMTQINRAQRQMVSISKYIQDIKYIEGILLAINNLSVDVDASMNRINDALGKLLDRHLNSEKEPLHEDDLKNLEKKDSIPMTQVYELLSAVLGRVEKKG